jgi:hypothetical protein
MRVFLAYIYNPDTENFDQFYGVYDNLDLLFDDFSIFKKKLNIEASNDDLLSIIETKLNFNSYNLDGSKE